MSCLKRSELLRKKKKEIEKSVGSRESITVDAKKGLDLHVPMSDNIVNCKV